MTNYNERLENRLKDLFHAGHMYGETGKSNPVEAVDEAKQAITSLVKELVEEAKPGTWVYPRDADDPEWQGYVRGVEHFEQNLLKALEEV